MLLKTKENIFNDGIAKVESYDFSTSNLNEESRIKAVTTVASICYGNPKGVGSLSLYNRLEHESAGLPSSSFEFCPILLDAERLMRISSLTNKFNEDLDIVKFGEMLNEEGYVLTNLRALISDVGEYAKDEIFYNTTEECEIIKKYFKVFRAKVDLATRTQMIRHRATYQELSRRYVSNDRQPFEFYISEDMKDVESPCDETGVYRTQMVIDVCLEHYKEAIKQGVKPQKARAIIPQCAYSDIWVAFLPRYYDNFIQQRTDKHAQWEIQQLANSIKELSD